MHSMIVLAKNNLPTVTCYMCRVSKGRYKDCVISFNKGLKFEF